MIPLLLAGVGLYVLTRKAEPPAAPAAPAPDNMAGTAYAALPTDLASALRALPPGDLGRTLPDLARALALGSGGDGVVSHSPWVGSSTPVQFAPRPSPAELARQAGHDDGLDAAPASSPPLVTLPLPPTTTPSPSAPLDFVALGFAMATPPAGVTVPADATYPILPSNRMLSVNSYRFAKP